MKELKAYISEGFFSNVGANNIIKPAIDLIKDASMNNKIDSNYERFKFADSLVVILKDLEADMKKGKLIFEYIRNDSTKDHMKIMISLEITEPGKVRWTYSSKNGKFGNSADVIAFDIAEDLYYETRYSPRDSKLQHSIANTIKVIEFKLS